MKPQKHHYLRLSPAFWTFSLKKKDQRNKPRDLCVAQEASPEVPKIREIEALSFHPTTQVNPEVETPCQVRAFMSVQAFYLRFCRISFCILQSLHDFLYLNRPRIIMVVSFEGFASCRHDVIGQGCAVG